jgi:transcriptional regulator with XRE-family HTH domain
MPRVSRRAARYPVQRQKMAELFGYLKTTHAVASQAELAAAFGVDQTTISSWMLGETALGVRDKKVFHHDFGVRPEYWDDPHRALRDCLNHQPETLDLETILRHVVQIWDQSPDLQHAVRRIWRDIPRTQDPTPPALLRDERQRR